MNKTIKWQDIKARRKLNILLATIKNKRNLLERISVQAQNGIEKNFDAQKDSKNRPWKPLSPVTLAIRRNQGNSSVKILQDTGRLRTITYDVTNSKAVVGTSVNYGKTHNNGGTSSFNGKSVKIPKRQWLYINKKTEEKIFRVMLSYFEGVFK